MSPPPTSPAACCGWVFTQTWAWLMGCREDLGFPSRFRGPQSEGIPGLIYSACSAFFSFFCLPAQPSPPLPSPHTLGPISFQPPNPDASGFPQPGTRAEVREGMAFPTLSCSSPVAWPNIFAFLGHRHQGAAVKPRSQWEIQHWLLFVYF